MYYKITIYGSTDGWWLVSGDIKGILATPPKLPPPGIRGK